LESSFGRSIGGWNECSGCPSNIKGILPSATGAHPLLKITLQEPPEPSLPFTDGIRRQIALARPAGHCAAVEATQVLGCIFGTEETTCLFFVAVHSSVPRDVSALSYELLKVALVIPHRGFLAVPQFDVDGTDAPTPP